MTSNMKRRLKAIEMKLNAKSDDSFQITLIEGGLPGLINWAYAGSHRWQRAEGEDLETFIEWAAKNAQAIGETSLVVGGLPHSDEFAGLSFEDWWATIAPYYPEVPPEETRTAIIS